MNTNYVSNLIIGGILSCITTIIPFFLIKYNFFSKKIILIISISCAVIQIYIHLNYFLHINNDSDNFWNKISLIFTIFILLILILGSMWIMFHLHHNLIFENI